MRLFHGYCFSVVSFFRSQCFSGDGVVSERCLFSKNSLELLQFSGGGIWAGYGSFDRKIQGYYSCSMIPISLRVGLVQIAYD